MTVLKIEISSQFKKDLKKVKKQNKDRALLDDIVLKLRKKEKLPLKNKDHLLSSNWGGFRECHISPDWLLIYKADNDLELLRLVRTGSHSELF